MSMNVLHNQSKQTCQSSMNPVPRGQDPACWPTIWGLAYPIGLLSI